MIVARQSCHHHCRHRFSLKIEYLEKKGKDDRYIMMECEQTVIPCEINNVFV